MQGRMILLFNWRVLLQAQSPTIAEEVCEALQQHVEVAGSQLREARAHGRRGPDLLLREQRRNCVQDLLPVLIQARRLCAMCNTYWNVTL